VKTSTASDTGSRDGSTRRLTPWLLVALLLAASAWHWNHGPALGADDHGQYLLHARAIAHGASYSDIGFLHSRYTTLIAPVAEPPGLPFSIAVIFATLGENMLAVRALLVLALLVFAVAVWRYWRPIANDTVAAFVVAWSAVALLRLHTVDTVLADVPFAAALWFTLALVDAPGDRRTPAFAWLALAGALAFSFRMAALPLIPALALYAVAAPPQHRRGYVVVGLAWALAAVAVLFLLPGASSLGSEVARGSDEVARDAWINGRTAFEGARQWVPIELPGRTANLVLDGVLLVIAGIGALIVLREHPWRFAHLTTIWYLVMLVALPTRAARYVWPLYPLLTFAFIRGASWLVQKAAIGPRVRPLAPAFGVLLLTIGLLQDAFSGTPPTLARSSDAREVIAALHRADSVRGPGAVRVAFFGLCRWPPGFTLRRGTAAAHYARGDRRRPDERSRDG
jgi:hypothetical protein